MTTDNQGEVPIHVDGDIVTVRRTVREKTTRLGFGITDVTRIVTAASELARNIVLYTGGGCMTWRLVTSGQKTGIELVFVDQGPGIADITQAIQDGYSTSRGLGMGLPGARRLMDEMDILSEPGKGTTVTVRKWRR